MKDSSRNQARIAISSDFLSALALLPRKIQGRVQSFLEKVQSNPNSSGLNYEKIKNAADPKMRSLRVDDTYRVIMVREDQTGTFLLLWVDHHDEAYAWAQKRKCTVNLRSGAIQVYAVQNFAEEDLPGVNPGVNSYDFSAATRMGSAAPPLFYAVGNSDLLTLGVPAELLEFVRKIPNQAAFHAAESVFPKDAYEYLSWLAEGIAVSEVLELAAAERSPLPVDGGLAAALGNLQTQKSFVVVEGEEELKRILEEPLEKWRVFLHPTQRKLVTKNYSGPFRILGGAGTGKTVVAMHRAKFLASQGTGKILFTTFTRNLADDISMNLRKICTDEEFQRIEVVNLDALMKRFFEEQNYQFEILYDNKKNLELWKEAKALAGDDSEFTPEFFEEEWNRVAAAQNAFTQETYLLATRSRRGTRLDRPKKIQVWRVFEARTNLMKERGLRDVNTAMAECGTLVSQLPDGPCFPYVIVDESQDFSPNAFRFLRALAGEPHENDLFIVGDSHQRIYRNRAVLSACGINVRGRSSTLRINYRTTDETRRFAMALLKGLAFDDLDDSALSEEECQSLTHGQPPIRGMFADSQEEFDFVLGEIRRLQEEGANPEDVCVTARTNQILKFWESKFTENSVPTFTLGLRNADERSREGVRLATMHRVKGLEFKYVFIVSANAKITPMLTSLDLSDEISRSEALTAEKCLLYVALTRAQKTAFITSYGEPSAFLK